MYTGKYTWHIGKLFTVQPDGAVVLYSDINPLLTSSTVPLLWIWVPPFWSYGPLWPMEPRLTAAISQPICNIDWFWQKFYWLKWLRGFRKWYPFQPEVPRCTGNDLYFCIRLSYLNNYDTQGDSDFRFELPIYELLQESVICFAKKCIRVPEMAILTVSGGHISVTMILRAILISDLNSSYTIYYRKVLFLWFWPLPLWSCAIFDEMEPLYHSSVGV
jgi:hypothetical protein